MTEKSSNSALVLTEATHAVRARGDATEALRQLEVVEIISNRCARGRRPSMLEVVEVYEVWGVLEAHAGAAAAHRITSEQLERLRRATETFRDIVADLQDEKKSRWNGAASSERSRCHDAYGAFHSLIIEASGNRTLGEVLDGLSPKIPQNLSRQALSADICQLKRNVAEHERIFAAINAGDAEGTRQLLLAHARNASELLVRALGDATPADGSGATSS
jgi:DNA-binding GntR family transcriptional regulator